MVTKKKVEQKQFSFSKQDLITALKIVGKLFPAIIKAVDEESKKKAPKRKAVKKKPKPKRKR